MFGFRKFLKLLRAQDLIVACWSKHKPRRGANYRNAFLASLLLDLFEDFFLTLFHFLLDDMLTGPVALGLEGGWDCRFESLEQATKVGYDNILDIIAMGFDPKLTRIIVDTEYIHHLYPIAVEAAKRITFSTTQAVFGFTNSNNIGEIFYTSIQAAPAFLPSAVAKKPVPVLIPCGIDQDPHFRIARDVAPRLGFPKPALIHNKLLMSLQGPSAKMSASLPESSIFTTDTEKAAQKKIMNAFTGGRATVEEQRRLGANPHICPIFNFYQYIFDPDDADVAGVERTCQSGERLCGECKQQLWGLVRPFLKKHHDAREKAKDRIEDFVVRD